jgi:beta-glucosidase
LWREFCEEAALRVGLIEKLHQTLAVLALLLGAIPALSQSLAPPVRPSSVEIDHRVQSLLKEMTLEEKIDYIGGTGFGIRAIPHAHVPAFQMSDGPLGTRNDGPATAMAAGIALAATWDRALANRVGREIGRDARARGDHFLLGPGVNIYRAPLNGRNFEYFGEDPFLASRVAVSYIKGVQSEGVSATIKHFLGNNSEYGRHSTDSVIDERTMREIYLPTFEAAVKEAHVGAIMDSYNLTNGVHMTQNEYLNTEVVKNEWGFRGLIMSDWNSTYDGVAAANSGLDLEMPSGAYMNRKTLLTAIEEGRVSIATIDDKVRRILRTAIEFRWLDRDQTDLLISRYNKEGRTVSLEASREGMVLLKNQRNLLPLSKQRVRSVAVIGPGGYPAVPAGGGSARVTAFAAISFLEGLGNYLGTGVNVYYSRGIPTVEEMATGTPFLTAESNGRPGLEAEYFSSEDLTGSPLTSRTELHVAFGPIGPGKFNGSMSYPDQAGSARWTGYYVPAISATYDVFVESTGEAGGTYRLYLDDRLVFNDSSASRAMLNHATLSLDLKPHKIVLERRGRSGWLGPRLYLGIAEPAKLVSAEAKALAAKADVVVVPVGFDPDTESEGADRTFELPPGQDELIQQIAAANKNTIVVLTSGGSVDTSRWLDRVPALVEAWYPGEEGGTALAQILFGDVNPSGCLPITFEGRLEDNPAYANYYPEAGTNRIVYKEGVFVGYRGYEHNGTKALFPFGYGLSYTTFEYSGLAIRPIRAARAGPQFQVSFDVRNTGTRPGASVAQVYVGDMHARVPRPPKELKGFSRVDLRPGETKRVTVELDRRSFSYYDVDRKQWRAAPGTYDVLVGRSSERIELRGKLVLADTAAVSVN